MVKGIPGRVRREDYLHTYLLHQVNAGGMMDFILDLMKNSRSRTLGRISARLERQE